MGQQSGSKAPDSEEREHFIASTSISGAFFCKTKIDKFLWIFTLQKQFT